MLTDLAITGKPAQFGRGVMQDVSDKLLGQFVACLEERLGGAEAAAAPSRRARAVTAEAAAAGPRPAPAPRRAGRPHAGRPAETPSTWGRGAARPRQGLLEAGRWPRSWSSR